MLYKKIGADGIKTGYLAVEKYSLASSVIKESRRLIAVGSGFETKKARTSESIKLHSWGFRNSVTYEVSKKNKTYFEVDTWLGKNKKVKAITKEDVYLTLSKKDSRKFNVFIEYIGPIKAPIDKGSKIAKLLLYNKDKLIQEVNLYSDEDVKKINFFKSFLTSVNYMIWGDV